MLCLFCFGLFFYFSFFFFTKPSVDTAMLLCQLPDLALTYCDYDGRQPHSITRQLEFSTLFQKPFAVFVVRLQSNKAAIMNCQESPWVFILHHDGSPGAFVHLIHQEQPLFRDGGNGLGVNLVPACVIPCNETYYFLLRRVMRKKT